MSLINADIFGHWDATGRKSFASCSQSGILTSQMGALPSPPGSSQGHLGTQHPARERRDGGEGTHPPRLITPVYISPHFPLAHTSHMVPPRCKGIWEM